MAKPLKTLINRDSVVFLSDLLGKYFTSFDPDTFQLRALPTLSELSLTARVNLLSAEIAVQLPGDFQQVAEGLRQLAADWPDTEYAAGWQNYIAWPVINFAGTAGWHNPAQAVVLLGQLTHLFTAEFAIRPYIAEHFDVVYPILLDWTNDADLHRRRLASEGLRPRLPWGKHLDNVPVESALALLARLKDDPSLYVRKSVANHLNDLTKTHPDRVRQLCREWQKTPTSESQWIIGQALRTLVKRADRLALAILDYHADLPVSCQSSIAPKTCRIGETVQLRLTLHNTSELPLNLYIDYQLYYQRKQQTAFAKVFFWRRQKLAASANATLEKTIALQTLSTRQLYPGKHQIYVRINGQIVAEQMFHLMR